MESKREHMGHTEELLLENEALRDRLSRLSEASLRINESLDFDTVLQGVLDSARSLTSARYGVMTLLDKMGNVQNFLSSGLTPEEAQKLWTLPEGMQLFEHLESFSEPLRMTDFNTHARMRGLPDVRWPIPTDTKLSYLSAPIRHREQRVGAIYVGVKEAGVEFTREDEETLVMFASQSALVISNARRHREEQKARTDLETLINTSPVGVVVIDAITGVPISINREAGRLFGLLVGPGRPLDELLVSLEVGREDGRKVKLSQSPLAKVLSDGEVVIAEELVLQAPGGRSFTAIVNATPIPSDDGRIETFVVTLQDMAPLKEMERLRAEFLGMVSHELQAPLASIRGSATTLLQDEPDLDSVEMRQFFRIIEREATRMRSLISDLLDVAHIETGSLSISPGPVDVTRLVDEAKNTFVSSAFGNVIQIDLPPDLPWVVADHRRILQVLSNLLSNAARHSPEESTIRVAGFRTDICVALSVTDEGVGLPVERLPHLFRKFYRSDGENRERNQENSGLGLAICKGIIEAHGGRIWADSDGQGLGARFTFTLPVIGQSVIGTLPGPVYSSDSQLQQGTKRKRILAVDDDPQVLRLLRETLSKADYETQVTAAPKEALRLMKKERPHLVLMDLMLPGTNGIDLMQEMLECADVPIIFLSAYGQDDVVARAFEMGAEDYVVKPFSPTELIARIKASFRRREENNIAEPPQPYVLSDLSIDYGPRAVTVGGRAIQLTPTEYDVLFELSANAGTVLTHEVLLRRVWGPSNSGDAGLVRTIIKRLRQKLGDDANKPCYILTEPRVGYCVPLPDR